jgi:hypothetical protein
MAIGPEQLMDSFKEDLKEFEKIIDRNLQLTSFKNSNTYVKITAPRDMLDTHFKLLREAYLKAGWSDVRREYGHQREPENSIIFTK